MLKFHAILHNVSYDGILVLLYEHDKKSQGFMELSICKLHYMDGGPSQEVNVL